MFEWLKVRLDTHEPIMEIETRGCMATIVGEIKRGRIIDRRFNDRVILPHYPKGERAYLVEYEDGAKHWRPAASYLRYKKGDSAHLPLEPGVLTRIM